MTLDTDDNAQGPIRTRMKGAIVKVLEKAKRDKDKKTQGERRFPRAGGYVSLAQTGLRKMFKTDAWGFDGWGLDRPRLDVAEPTPTNAAQDPVKLVSLAINRLGPASYRAAIFGTPVTIAVEDEATAEVLRAAVQMSCAERPTNHLIQVVVK